MPKWKEESDSGRELFPIQAEGSGTERYPRTFVPWWLAEIAYKAYSKKFGNRQTLDRIANRGGFGREEILSLLGKEPVDKTEVTEIKICKLPYQEHPFVHGVRNGTDVWLMSNGEWTEIDGHEMADILLSENLTIEEKK